MKHIDAMPDDSESPFTSIEETAHCQEGYNFSCCSTKVKKMMMAPLLWRRRSDLQQETDKQLGFIHSDGSDKLVFEYHHGMCLKFIPYQDPARTSAASFNHIRQKQDDRAKQTSMNESEKGQRVNGMSAVISEKGQNEKKTKKRSLEKDVKEGSPKIKKVKVYEDNCENYVNNFSNSKRKDKTLKEMKQIPMNNSETVNNRMDREMKKIHVSEKEKSEGKIRAKPYTGSPFLKLEKNKYTIKKTYVKSKTKHSNKSSEKIVKAKGTKTRRIWDSETVAAAMEIKNDLMDQAPDQENKVPDQENKAPDQKNCKSRLIMKNRSTIENLLSQIEGKVLDKKKTKMDNLKRMKIDKVNSSKNYSGRASYEKNELKNRSSSKTSNRRLENEEDQSNDSVIIIDDDDEDDNDVTIKEKEVVEIFTCDVCGKTATISCEGCRAAVYCSVKCGTRHWIEHHYRVCNPSRAVVALGTNTANDNQPGLHDKVTPTVPNHQVTKV